MQIGPVRPPLVRRPPAPDYLVLVYAANNVSDARNAEQPVAGSYRLMPELKALAPQTESGRVAILAQGYERTPEGRWETHRYRIDGGQAQEESPAGLEYLYDGKKLQAKQAGTGPGVSMFSPESLKDFVQSGLRRYPSARHVVLLVGAHGDTSPKLSGEAIVNGRREPWVFESVALTDLTHVLAGQGRKLDLIDLNCCEMGKAENVLELAPHANLVVASPQDEYAPKGHEATAAFQDVAGACQELCRHPEMSPREFGQTLLDSSVAKMTFTENGKVENAIPTLDLYDSAALPRLGQAMGELGRRLSQQLDEPAGRRAILEAVGQAFRYHPQVADLKSFAQAVGAPKVVEALDSVKLAEFRGQFRERDYRGTGPLSIFLPNRIDPSEAALYRVEPGPEPLALVDRLLKEEPPSRRWAMRAAGDLSDLVTALATQYPAMLEVVPHPGLKDALQGVSQKELEQLASDLAGGADGRERLRAALAPLREKLQGLNTADWAARFQAAGGEKLLAERAGRKLAEHALQELARPLAMTAGLEQLPPDWNAFVQKLARVVANEA